MAAGLAFKDHRQRMHQESVYPDLELIADQKRHHQRADRPHQPVAQLDQVLEKRHPAGFELGLAIVAHCPTYGFGGAKP